MMEDQSFVSEAEDGFPEEVSEDVDGLLWLGYLEDEFEFCGHEFVIRTLRLEEEMTTGLLSKEYAESMSEAKALITAQIAMSLIAIDGREDFCPAIGPNKKDHARARFNYIASHWFEPTLAFVYSKYADLIERQRACIREMDFLSRESLNTFMDSPSFLKKKVDSQMTGEIMDILDSEQD